MRQERGEKNPEEEKERKRMHQTLVWQKGEMFAAHRPTRRKETYIRS